MSSRGTMIAEGCSDRRGRLATPRNLSAPIEGLIAFSSMASPLRQSRIRPVQSWLPVRRRITMTVSMCCLQTELSRPSSQTALNGPSSRQSRAKCLSWSDDLHSPKRCHRGNRSAPLGSLACTTSGTWTYDRHLYAAPLAHCSQSALRLKDKSGSLLALSCSAIILFLNPCSGSFCARTFSLFGRVIYTLPHRSSF